MNLPVLVLLAVFLLIALRQVLLPRRGIWQIMLAGALAVLLTGQISPRRALEAIDPDVMLFLFGMFVVGAALEESGYLSHLSSRLLRARSVDSLVLGLLFLMGFSSALLMNDTLAIIGTPLVLLLARRHGLPPKLLLLTLAFAVTTGSVLSPIGNPQNLLIALRLDRPFPLFFRYLFLPTLVNLLLAYLLLRLFYRRHFGRRLRRGPLEPIRDRELARLSRLSLGLALGLVGAKVTAAVLLPQLDFRLTYIALGSALPLLLFSRRRLRLLRLVDWPTLVFFASMFVLMESVWSTGFFQSLLERTSLNLLSVPSILLVGVLLSQLLSNVPLVALYLPLLLHAGASSRELVTLAAGSTLAGNLTILGAASNVIIIQNAERRGETLTFFEFVRVGLPLTLAQLGVCWLFLELP
ncbi:MAG: anion transporter [Hadesarchaea archaeon]|jgi:Na+/H+ antiporter NhaD/arsenite permease-like protein|nr:MAG: anion transporter [Hadesarchaea archaeon]